VEIDADLDTNCLTEPKEDFIICGNRLMLAPDPNMDALE
jgi:hypothetical protein